MDVKIYKMNDCDWVAAKTPEEALKWYIEVCWEGIEDDADTDIDTVHELTEEELDSLKFWDVDDPLVEENGMRTYPFREALRIMIEDQEEEPPFLFASTEY